MNMRPVKSSNIKSLGYDPSTNTLAVEFSNGGRYHYADVSAEEFERFEKAESLGTLGPSICQVRFARWKPSAVVTLDDRGITFTGTWPDPHQLHGFRPWNKPVAPR